MMDGQHRKQEVASIDQDMCTDMLGLQNKAHTELLQLYSTQ